MSERKSFQNFHEGRDGETDVFVLKTASMTCFGVEVGGFIHYIIPNKNEYITTIAMCWDGMNEHLKAIGEYSQPRFEILKEHCPKLCRSIEDSIADRYDRASVVVIEGHCCWVKDITYNSIKQVKEKGIEALVDDVIIIARQELLEFLVDMAKELHDWEGFTSWEEVKIGAKEALPGARVGLSIGRILSGL